MSSMTMERSALIAKLQILAAVAQADGHVSPQEDALLRAFCADLGLTRSELEGVLRKRLAVPQARLPKTLSEKRRLLTDVFKIAAADGRVADSEMSLGAKLAETLGLSVNDIADALDEAQNWYSRSQRARREAQASGTPASHRLAYEVRRFEGHTGSVLAVAFSPDGRHAFTISSDRSARIWDVETGKEVRRFAGHSSPAVSAAFSPDGRHVLTGFRDGSVHLWKTGLDD